MNFRRIYIRKKFKFSDNRYLRYIFIFSFFNLIPLIGCLNPIKTNALKKDDIKTVVNENLNISKTTQIQNNDEKNIKTNEKIEQNKEILEKIKKGEDFKIKIKMGNEIKDIFFSEYIFGVVASEIGLDWPIEAIKAQMIAAASYIIKKVGVNGVVQIGNHLQTYIDKEKIEQKYGEKGRSLFNQLKQEGFMRKILVDDKSRIIECLYDSCVGGFTRSNEEVWGNADRAMHNKNLSSNFSPELELIEKFERMSKEEQENFKNKFPEEYRFIDKFKDKIKSKKVMPISEVYTKVKPFKKEAIMPANNSDIIKNISTYDHGYVKEIEIFGTKVSGEFMRRQMPLVSANFKAKVEGENIVFECLGNGHGVGMSQMGAILFSIRNQNYEQILKHYYSENGNVNSVKVVDLKDLEFEKIIK